MVAALTSSTPTDAAAELGLAGQLSRAQSGLYPRIAHGHPFAQIYCVSRQTFVHRTVTGYAGDPFNRRRCRSSLYAVTQQERNWGPERMPEPPELPGEEKGQPRSRVHTDATGRAWTVWEITPGPLPPKLERLLGREVGAGGALLFVSESNEWRELTPVPAGWIRLKDTELEVYRARARVVRAD